MNTSFKLGNGINIRFWKDRWLQGTVLMNEFSDLYQIANDQDSSISQNWQDNCWQIQFRRDFQDWEIPQLLSLLAKLEGYSVNHNIADNIKWMDGLYSVKAGYSHLCSTNEIIDRWPWKYIWKTNLPPKITCFSWIALNESCLTQDNLNRRGMPIINRCFMCRQHSESNRHLLLHCSVASDMWCMFLSIFGLSWVMPQSIREVYECWSGWKVDRVIRKVW